MKAAGLGLKKQELDNECLAAMKACIKDNNMDYKLVPPGQHRQNQAERAIQTFNAHFVSILAGVDNKIPSIALVPPTQASRTHFEPPMPIQSSTKNIGFAHIHDTQHYMQKPFPPIGCAV